MDQVAKFHLKIGDQMGEPILDKNPAAKFMILNVSLIGNSDIID